MPIYEYSCAKCGKTIELIQKMSDKPLKTHAGCGGKLTKLISASGFQFKGTGWYVTDYARKSQGESREDSTDAKDAKADQSKDAGAATAKDGGSDKSSSDKPAAEKPAKPASPPASSGKTKKS